MSLMKLKKIAAAGIIAAMLSTATACNDETVVTTHEEAVNISFSWWGNDARNEYTMQAIEIFEELNPDINVICNYSEWSGYQVRNNVQMVSNTEADVMQINFAWIEQYSPKGTGYYDINKLSDYIDLSCFTENDLSFGMKNGYLNAIPIALNTQTVYVNKTIYDQYGLDIPTTWDEIFEAAEVMNGENYPMTANVKAMLFYLISYTEQQSGHEFITKDGKLGFDTDDLKVMLEFYKQLVDKKVAPQTEYYERLNLDSGNYAGTVAWLSDASSYLGGAEEAGYEVVIADYTKSESAETLGWYSKPATMYAISANTEYPEQSARLLDFLLNSKEMAELQGVEKGIPLSSAARGYLEESGLLKGLQYEAFLKMNENAEKLKDISPYHENTDILDLIQQSCNVVLFGKSDSDDEAILLKENLESVLNSLQD